LRRTLQALALLVALLAVGVAAAQGFDQAGYDQATSTILCDCGCHPQSVHDCACGRAAEMREEMRAMIVEGKTGDDIVAAYVAEHGEQIRVAPKAEGFNLVAWLGPALALLVASGSMFFVLRRWSNLKGSSLHDPAPAPAGPPVDDAYRQRLDRALEKME